MNREAHPWALNRERIKQQGTSKESSKGSAPSSSHPWEETWRRPARRRSLSQHLQMYRPLHAYRVAGALQGSGARAQGQGLEGVSRGGRRRGA